MLESTVLFGYTGEGATNIRLLESRPSTKHRTSPYAQDSQGREQCLLLCSFSIIQASDVSADLYADMGPKPVPEIYMLYLEPT